MHEVVPDPLKSSSPGESVEAIINLTDFFLDTRLVPRSVLRIREPSAARSIHHAWTARLSTALALAVTMSSHGRADQHEEAPSLIILGGVALGLPL